jgi:hypothetical protein
MCLGRLSYSIGTNADPQWGLVSSRVAAVCDWMMLRHAEAEAGRSLGSGTKSMEYGMIQRCVNAAAVCSYAVAMSKARSIKAEAST